MTANVRSNIRFIRVSRRIKQLESLSKTFTNFKLKCFFSNVKVLNVLIVELDDINAIISLENVTNNRLNIPVGSFRFSLPSHFLLFYENS